MPYVIVPIPASLVDEARRTGRSPQYGHPAHREVAAGYGPCRSCLRPFRQGAEDRLLFTYDPFGKSESLPLPGPVFVHADACDGYEGSGGFPSELRFIPATLNAYGRGRKLREVRYVEPGSDAERVIDELLARPDVDYIHVRNTEAGCFMFEVRRD